MTLLYKLFLTFATDVRKNLHLEYWSDKKANELNIEFSPKFWLQVERIQFKYQFCKIVENRYPFLKQWIHVYWLKSL